MNLQENILKNNIQYKGRESISLSIFPKIAFYIVLWASFS